MARPKVYVCRPLPDEALGLLRARTEMRIWEQEEIPPPREVLLREVAEIDGLLSLLTDRVDTELLERAPRLRVGANCAVGFDNIDVPASTARGVVVTNTPGVLTETVADFTMCLILGVARRIVEADQYTRANRWRSWEPMLFLGQDIHGATLGLVGLGRIGGAVARRARGFGMRILYHDVVRREDLEADLGIEFRPFEEVLREADFISLHVPLAPETRHLIGPDQLKLMKPTAVLVNTSRGPVVDTMALSEALRDRRISGAGIDVFEVEPVPADHPLLGLDNVVVTPHISGPSKAEEITQVFNENLARYVRGERLRYVVDKKRGY
jgi:glyoxylate reductase